jgi:hypothetical protein
MSRMLREIVRGVLAPEPDLEVVGEVPEPVELEAAVDRSGATLVILSGDGPAGADSWELLERRPRVRVLAVTADGRRISMHIGELSPASLVAAVRGAAAWREPVES